MKFSELPKNDDRWEPAAWWCAPENYGKGLPSGVRFTDAEFHVLRVSDLFVKVVVKNHDDAHYTILRKDISDWCMASLKGWWSVIQVKYREEYVAFSEETDMMLFRLKWL